MSKLDTTQVYVFTYNGTDRMLFWDTNGWHEEWHHQGEWMKYPWRETIIDEEALTRLDNFGPNYSLVPTGPCGQCDNPAQLSDYLCSQCRST